MQRIANSKSKMQTFKCDQCSKRCRAEHRLRAHQRVVHQGLEPYSCDKDGCARTFNRYESLMEHMMVHEGVSFPCKEPGCDLVYHHKAALKMHIRKNHRIGIEPKIHVCEVCGKSCKDASLLRNHSYTHKDISAYPFACEEPNCGKRFIKKDKLKDHIKRHKGIKEYVCPYCGLKKTTHNELKRHMNCHTNEKTWSCSYCTHVCNSLGNLKTHIRRVHERARDYACRYCEMAFSKPDTRKHHEMTHTGEKPNVCPECSKAFIQPTALKTHRKTHYPHGDVPPLPKKPRWKYYAPPPEEEAAAVQATPEAATQFQQQSLLAVNTSKADALLSISAVEATNTQSLAMQLPQ